MISVGEKSMEGAKRLQTADASITIRRTAAHRPAQGQGRMQRGC